MNVVSSEESSGLSWTPVVLVVWTSTPEGPIVEGPAKPDDRGELEGRGMLGGCEMVMMDDDTDAGLPVSNQLCIKRALRMAMKR